MPNYLKEAFKELELLNEETFSFDKDGAAELKKFYDGDTTDDYESIIDPEAETKDELEDSYEGKVIIACKICHGMQYKDPQDIVIDEESDYVNVGEECPACSAVDGFKVVGQVAPYCAECDDEHEEEESEEPVEGEVELVAESLKESYVKIGNERYPVSENVPTVMDVIHKKEFFMNPDSALTRPTKIIGVTFINDKGEIDGMPIQVNYYNGYTGNNTGGNQYEGLYDGEVIHLSGTTQYKQAVKELPFVKKVLSWDNPETFLSRKKVVDESLNEKRKASRIIESLKSAPKRHFKESLNEEKLTTLFDVVGGMLDGTMDRITINKKTGKKQAVGTKTPYDAAEDIGIDDDGYFVWVADEAGAKYAQEVADKFGLKTKLDAPTKYISARNNRKFHIYIPENRYDEPVEQVVEESCGKLKEGHDKDTLIHDILSKLKQEGYDVRGRDARTYADGAAELIMIAPNGCTVDKWFEDTKRNHPEDLLKFKKFSDLRESGDKLLNEFGVSNRKVEREEDAKTKGIGFSRARKLKQALEKDLSIKVSGPKVHKFDEQPFVDVSLNFEHPTVGSVQFVVHCENPDYFWVEDDLGVVQKQLVTMEDVVDFIGGVLDGRVNPYGMNESVENVKVETDSDIVEVTPGEDGTIKVEADPKAKVDAEETIVPVSAETKDEIDMNDANFDETDVDIDIDSIDDEGFDALGESYLKKVYENVKSFKTSSSSIKDGKLMVEGIISFNSGKKAKTSFVFESISKTKRGKIKFLGENLNFSKSKSAFTLIAKPEGKKAVCESLTYNYVAKDSKSNKKLPVYGKVSK